jgi:cyclophilin family peptidyl-prolyl cis-trans isomerase
MTGFLPKMSRRAAGALLAAALAGGAWAADAPRVKFATTLGDFVVELAPDKAPKTVDNFLQYVKDKHYDGTVFHRVIEIFMVQGGGFTPDMKQKPMRAPVVLEAGNGLKNEMGTIAMARTGDPDSATSQATAMPSSARSCPAWTLSRRSRSCRPETRGPTATCRLHRWSSSPPPSSNNKTSDFGDRPSALSPTFQEGNSMSNPKVDLHIKGYGVITLELDQDKAPKSVENFLAYVKKGHYDNTVFHRVIPGFMVQGGGFTQQRRQERQLHRRDGADQ